jgi:hypothetical protein
MTTQPTGILAHARCTLLLGIDWRDAKGQIKSERRHSGAEKPKKSSQKGNKQYNKMVPLEKEKLKQCVAFSSLSAQQRALAFIDHPISMFFLRCWKS